MKLKNIKAVLYDWDDTIINTKASVTQLLKDFSNNQNLSPLTDDLLKTHWGKPVPAMLSSFWPDENITELVKKFFDSVSDSFSPKPFDDVGETLKGLERKGLLLGVVSSTPKRAFEQVIKIYPEVHSPNYFHIQTAEDCEFFKPDPRVFDMVISKLEKEGIKKSQVVYVGDGLYDFEAAKNRNLTFVAVTTGFISREEFIKKGLNEKLILNNFSELKNLL
ncbi:HAD hydrolase-like protein [Candidatus Microgenomates bacterium]|nr:HAD hydrolase-like protein [Candidatus Microgenomates bacterium]